MEDKDLELQLVSSEQAEELEYLGFPIKVLDIVDETYRDGVKLNVPEGCYVSKNYYILRCPSLELVAKWLRKDKSISIIVEDFECENEYNVYFSHLINTSIVYTPDMIRLKHEIWRKRRCDKWESENYSEYEQALSAGIDKAIEILKEQQQ